ncbi:MAG TPA: DNA polymerase ligase N-terminal domain-containing protein [Isosphaeraceae bacterium]
MPRFAVLEHRWGGVHWDLLLEHGGALRTWALEAPIEPGREVPARALPDHRLVYLEYEGAVSGGRGTVRRVDAGQYEARTWAADLVRIRLTGAQLSGEAELRRIQVGAAETPLGWVFRFGKVD